jgi:hypothetical protein
MITAMRIENRATMRTAYIDHLAPFIGVIKSAPPGLSESVDDIYR